MRALFDALISLCYTGSMQAVILAQYLAWHFIGAPKELLNAWSNMLWFVAHYFSLGLLFRTYFAPWRRIAWSYGKGFDPGRFFFTLTSNIISRLLGAFMRSVFIAAGLIAELVFFCVGLLLVIFWIFLPVFIAVAFVYGIFLIF